MLVLLQCTLFHLLTQKKNLTYYFFLLYNHHSESVTADDNDLQEEEEDSKSVDVLYPEFEDPEAVYVVCDTTRSPKKYKWVLKIHRWGYASENITTSKKKHQRFW